MYRHGDDCDCSQCEEDREWELQQRDDIIECAEAIQAVFRYDSEGGNLHCVISNGNVDCLPDPDGLKISKNRCKSHWQLKAERACVKMLSELECDERYAALKLAHQQMYEASVGHYQKPA